MTQSKSKFQFWQEASLSQKLADKIPIYQKLAGSDPETSEAIASLEVLGALGYIDLTSPTFKLILGLLNAKRQALFATSPHTNEISKMGMQMPKGEDVISKF